MSLVRLLAAQSAGLPRLRQRLVRSVWGQGGLPSSGTPLYTLEDYQGTSAHASWPTDVPRVDVPVFETLRGGVDVVHFCHPATTPAVSGFKRNRVVEVIGGHSDHYYALAAFLTYGLVREGFHVLGRCMPKDGFNQTQAFRTLAGVATTVNDHNFSALESDGASPLRFFLDGGIKARNWLEATHPELAYAGCVGISGGGWTTDMAAAVDPRISRSYPVFGSLPFSLRIANGGPGDNGDWEQLEARSYWDILGDYTTVYALACYEVGRKRMQFLGRQDPVFPIDDIPTEVAAYDAAVQARVRGEHEVVTDTTALDHVYSSETIAAIIADLKEAA